MTFLVLFCYCLRAVLSMRDLGDKVCYYLRAVLASRQRGRFGYGLAR